MLIRDYIPGEFSSVWELWEESGLNYPGRSDTPASVEATIAHGGRLLLAESQKASGLTGSLWLTCDGRRIHLHHLCVRPAYRLQGIATALIQEALTLAGKAGMQVRLDIHKHKAIPRHIFEKLGFFAYTDYDIYVLRDISD